VTVFHIVIPARHASTRLPGKPLVTIAGKPMLQWVHERASRARTPSIVVATDDERIRAAAQAFGADVQMTATTHASGTDRIAEVARARGWDAEAIVVNVQGDEPLMRHELIDQVADLLHADPDADIATLAGALDGVAAFHDTNVVKVVTDARGRALYFSRAPIPWDRDAGSEGIGPLLADPQARRHIGLYAYRVRALHALAALPPGRLEQLEKLEQLRALENGLVIRVAQAIVAPGPDVNTADDLARVEARLRA
jgi:3-deoxy-manno-octulosonate cytidylyltransferase (CMP-KDO synthetase)